jgi:hypothetical protein
MLAAIALPFLARKYASIRHSITVLSRTPSVVFDIEVP